MLSELSSRQLNQTFNYYVGNVFYNDGLIVITSPYYKNLSSSFDFILNIRGSKTIYEHEYICKIEPNEFNITTNSSIKKSIDSNDINARYLTSDFSPYITTIGLYNENAELVAIAKTSQPIKKLNKNKMNFVIKFDLVDDSNINLKPSAFCSNPNSTIAIDGSTWTTEITLKSTAGAPIENVTQRFKLYDSNDVLIGEVSITTTVPIQGVTITANFQIPDGYGGSVIRLERIGDCVGEDLISVHFESYLIESNALCVNNDFVITMDDSNLSLLPGTITNDGSADLYVSGSNSIAVYNSGQVYNLSVRDSNNNMLNFPVAEGYGWTLHDVNQLNIAFITGSYAWRKQNNYHYNFNYGALKLDCLNNNYLYIPFTKNRINEFLPVEMIEIEVNITNYTTQTSGINLAFTGNVKGKWIDQPSEFNFVSNNENIRTYAANGNYKLLIYGDLQNLKNFIANNSQISGLDMNNIPLNKSNLVNGTFDINNNPISTIQNFNYTESNLTLNKASGNYGLGVSNTQLSGIIDFANGFVRGINISGTTITELKGFNQNSLIGTITVSTSIQTIDFNNANVATNLSASNTNIEYLLNIGAGTFSRLYLDNTPIHNFDISKITSITDTAFIRNCPNLTNITFGASSIRSLYLDNCNLTGTIDFNNTIIPYGTGKAFSLPNNANLTDIINVDIQLAIIKLQGCALSQITIDFILQNLVDNNKTNGLCWMDGGTNAAPSATGLTNVSTLQNRGWTVITN